MKKLNMIHGWSDKSQMLFSGNTLIRAVGRLGVIGWMACLLGAITITASMMPARAQTPDQATLDAPLLDASYAKRAYNLVESWLAQKDGDQLTADPIRVTGLIAVRLTLRSQGIVVGQGVAYRPDMSDALDQPGHAIDLVPLLADATGQAKQGVLDSIHDAQMQSVVAGRNPSEKKQLTVADVHLNLVADLELAYDLQSISLPAGADDQALFTQFAPCYHGLAFHDDSTHIWAWVWPGEAITRNILPPTYLTLGLKRLGMDRGAIDQLARPGGIALARFKTLHIVRPDRGLEPIILVRSGTDQPKYPVDDKALVAMTDRLIEQLNNRFLDDRTMRGTYQPTSGRYDPAIAPPDQAALACYAIVRYCSLIAETRSYDNSRQTFLRKAIDATDLIADYALTPNAHLKPQVNALVLLTMLQAPADQVDKPLRDRIADLLVKQLTQPDAPQLKQAPAALVAASLASLYERTRQPEVGELARKMLDQVWDQPNKTPGVATMPWLILVDQTAGNLLYPDTNPDNARTRAHRRAVIAGVIDQLLQHQVIEPPQLGPDDVLGGFVLSPAPPGSPPNPDWRNAQALLILALALRDDAIVADHDKLGWLIAAGYAARFVGQLMMDDNSCFYVRDRVAARGGVRLAPWDNRLAVAPSAVSLLALTELQTTLNAMRPEPPGATSEQPPAE